MQSELVSSGRRPLILQSCSGSLARLPLLQQILAWRLHHLLTSYAVLFGRQFQQTALAVWKRTDLHLGSAGMLGISRLASVARMSDPSVAGWRWRMLLLHFVDSHWKQWWDVAGHTRPRYQTHWTLTVAYYEFLPPQGHAFCQSLCLVHQQSANSGQSNAYMHGHETAIWLQQPLLFSDFQAVGFLNIHKDLVFLRAVVEELPNT